MEKIKVDLGERSYHIYLGDDCFDQVPVVLAESGRNKQVVIISVPPVSGLYLEKLTGILNKHHSILHVDVPDGEKSKSAETVEYIYDRLLESGIERDSVIIALGGGVVGDLAGFVAATYLRGVDLIHVPTSLLAQVDSSIGGKVGINHRMGKNLIGAFYQPKAIVTDFSVLKTLPEAEYICGLGEVIKYGIIKDPALFGVIEAKLPGILAQDPDLLRPIVSACARIKAQVVSQDEKESGLRAILNYGHTFAHSLEKEYGYSGLKHGQAVLLGMICANFVSARLGMLPEETVQRIAVLIGKFSLQLPESVERPDVKQLVAHMYKDKKVRGGKIRLILATDIGQVISHDLTDDDLLAMSYEYLFDWLQEQN